MAVTLLGLVFVLPSLPGVKDSALGKLLPDKVINLGLDLKGGIHLTLGVDLKKAIENNMERIGEDIKASARDQDIALIKPDVVNGKIDITLVRSEKQVAFEKYLDDNYEGIVSVDGKKGLDNDRVEYTLALDSQYKKYLEDMTINQALKTIRNRIDEFGVAEPDIRKQQGGRIQVQLPGVQDPERAIRNIRRTAHLEFKIVDETADVEKAKKGVLPPGRELITLRRVNPDGSTTDDAIVVRKTAAMTGEFIQDARTAFDQFNQPYVTLKFNTRGARLFERITGENVKKRMAIVLDGVASSAPTIQEKIMGGSASISGRFSVEEARDLAAVLRAGALPAPIDILEQRAVGPSLGQESIDKGITSAAIGLAVVLVFMVIYYGFGGFVADLVLIMNIIMIMAGLAAFGATLTLPGIAGIILTIGMAVDANVIIFERIREELRRGLSSAAAVREGFGRATLTILDANVTTVIAAMILYQFGTGPIRGFAVTLSLGILSSMFTAIFVSRVLFDLYTGARPSDAKLSI